MTLPIPPRPAYFGPDGAPPGVELRLDAFGTWATGRPTITPRVAVVHTNGASVEASVQSSINYGNAGTNNTKPHYHVGDRPAKVLRTDLRSIANSTGETIEAQYGERDASFWTISIETADMGGTYAVRQGINWPTDCGPFLERPGDQPDDAEIVARILAYESIVYGFPLAVPDRWNGEGVVAHTEPWPYPYFTTVRGKTCPGTTKKRQVFDEILPRARQIAAAWTAPTTPPEVEPPEEDDDMPGPEYIRTPPTGSPKGWPFFYVRGGDVRYADGGDVEYAKANGIPIGPDPDATKAGERYRFLHLSVVGREPGQ